MSSADTSGERAALPRLISYPIDAILDLRVHLETALREAFAGEELFGRLDELVDVTASALRINPWKPFIISRTALVKSLQYLVGTKMRDSDFTDTAYRLAGNIPKLRRGQAVLPWTAQRTLEWVPLQITAVRPDIRYKDIANRCTFRVLAGSPAGLLATQWWSQRRCYWLARHFGFSRRIGKNDKLTSPPPKFPYTAPTEFVTLRLYGLVTPERSEREPGFDALAFPKSVWPWNREQLKYRRRTAGPEYACPLNFPLMLLCADCPIGFERCRAGTHRADYVLGDCQACGNPQALFNPDWEDIDVCVQCARKQLIQSLKKKG